MNVPPPGLKVIEPVEEPKDPINPSVTSKINFISYLDPFFNLLTSVGASFTASVAYIMHNTCELIRGTENVLFKILTKPIFNPHTIEFQKMIQDFEDQEPQLQEKINLFHARFCENSKISHDIHDLAELNKTIDETSNKLKLYHHHLRQRIEPLEIQSKIQNVKELYEELSTKLSFFISQRGESILDQFQEIFDVFMKGVAIPNEISQELRQNWELLAYIILRRCPDEANDIQKKYNKLFDQMKSLANNPTGHSNELEHPLQLKNIGNSCYMDCVLQAIFCIPNVCEQLHQPLPRGTSTKEEHFKKLAIQRELLQLVNLKKNQSNPYTKMEYILSLLGGPSLVRLRKAIFDSCLSTELTQDRLLKQHDAVYIMEVLGDLLGPSFQLTYEEHAKPDVFKNLEFIYEKEKHSFLRVPIIQAPQIDPQHPSLLKSLQYYVHQHWCRESNPEDQRLFDPKEGRAKVKVIDPKQPALVDAPAKKAPGFIQSYEFTQLPPVLAIQLKRSLVVTQPDKTFKLGKCEAPQSLKTADDIYDLGIYYKPEDPNAQKTARYKIKSYVVHKGESFDSGHFTAFVEMNGKYYECDDIDSNFYKEILPYQETDVKTKLKREVTAKEQFLGRTDAYLVFLERLPDDPVPAAAQPPVANEQRLQDGSKASL